MYMIFDFLASTKEYQGWGFNLLTVVFLTTLFESGALVWGGWHQCKTLESTETVSAAGINVYQKMVYVAFYASELPYAIDVRSVALLASLPLFYIQARIVWALWRVNRGFSQAQWTVLCLVAVGSISSFIPWLTAPIFGAAAYVLVGVYALQPLTMLTRRTAAGLNWRETFVAVLSTLLWSIYAVLIQSWLILSFCLPLLVLSSCVLVLYMKYTTK